MKEKGNISRKQFLTSCFTIACGTVLGKLSKNVYAEGAPQNENTSVLEKEWDQIPIGTLTGAYLISDPASPSFGGTIESETCSLSQYIHVYPGLELMFPDIEGDKENSWIGYNKELQPIAILRNSKKNKEAEKKVVVTIPANVYYLRGSCNKREEKPRVWVRNCYLYMMNSGISRPDVSSYMEITELCFNQHSRLDNGGRFDTNSRDYPSIGDVFFTPIGTDIILTFNNANIAPYIHSGENFTAMSNTDIFDRHYGFGYSWYHCKTTEICNYLGAYYEAVNGCVKTLTLDELHVAEPHLYIRFPSKVVNTCAAARIRTFGVNKSYKRSFTVVHITDTHGDADSTHAAYEYADQIGADFVALTGDYVPNRPFHGYNILHSIIKNSKTPTVYSVGNHDVADCSEQYSYDMNILPIKDLIQASEKHAYYYRDFRYEGEIIRAISLYPFGNTTNSQNGYYTQEQLMWLCDVLASTPDNGHVFILRHFAHNKPLPSEDGDTMFYDYGNDISDVSNTWLDMGGDPVTGIVDAYNKRERILAHYTKELKSEEGIVSIEYDFTRRTNSEFVAYFVGHVHCDAVGYTRNTHTRQAVLCSQCTTAIKGTKDYYAYASTNTSRDYGTESQIALNVFSFDFKKKSIYVARVGNGSFKDREKTWMELPYQ